MTSVVTLIKDQHREMDKLLKQAESEKGDVAKVLQQLHDLLKPHQDAEEDFVYPAVLKAAADTGDEVKDGTAEHHQMEELLGQLLEGKPGDPGYDGTVAALAAELRHHVEEEEEDLLPELQKNSTRAELDALGERFAKATGRKS